MNSEGPHALRSMAAPEYLDNANPGFTGGGTVLPSDPQTMMANYENIFGPAVRDIKWDEQRHKRHQRWHLPDALKGTNSFLTDRVDGLITDATSSPFTKNILPYMYMENPDKKIKWNVYSFDEGIASRVPYESAARVLPQSKRSFAGYAVRQGLAIAMEHNFMMSPAGRDNFRKQLMQLVGSIQLTNDLDVHMALLYAPSYQKHMDEKYFDTTRSVSQNCRLYVDLFGFMQKNENALDYLIEDAKNHLTRWGSKPPTFMLCNGALTRQLTMTPEKTNYITAGPDGKRKLAQGPDLPSYRGLHIVNTRQFSLEAGTAPRDMLRRRVRVSEHYRIPWEPQNLRKRYEFYDQSRDSMFYVSWHNLWRASFPQTKDDLHALVPPDSHEAENAEAEEAAMEKHALTGDFDTWFANSMAFRDLLSVEEIALAKLLGIIGYTGQSSLEMDFYPRILRDLDLTVETTKDDKTKISMLSIKADLANKHAWHYCSYMIILKKFLRQTFPNLTHALGDRATEDQKFVEICSTWMKTAIPDAPDRNNGSDDGASSIAGDEEMLSYDNMSLLMMFCGIQQKVTQTVKKNEKISPLLMSLGLAEHEFTPHDSIRCIASDLLLLRPCIEHYMLAVIMGRGGGGPEELGATFWGQTELSCYDDSQHGIWGMSYKYHERAIVTNERNLIRVFDVCFDGYCGGNDATFLKWSRDDLTEFKRCATALNDPYNGVSMLAMALPPLSDMQMFPNPIVLHTKYSQTPNTVPERSLRSNNTHTHAPFSMDHKVTPQARVYNFYYEAAGIRDWTQTFQAAGHLAYQNETDPYMFSFHGHMTTILDGQREETQGSGHLGPNFVGVASVREGRGMMPRGQPTLAHLV